MKRKLRYSLETMAVTGLLSLFRCLPLDKASTIGGFIGRFIGRHMSVNRKALRNLERALPGRAQKDYQKIILGMWDNLGRVFAEYPHLEEISQSRVEIVGMENLRPVIGEGNTCIYFTGHLANFEVPAAAAYQLGAPMDAIYRAANNPGVDKLFKKYRSMDGKIAVYPKSSQGMRDVMTALKNKRRIGLLIDQKYNQGIAMPFFGRDAMTSPAFAQLAQKFKAPLLPAQIERLDGAHFRLTINPPLETQGRSVEEIITDAHRMLESWITQHPEQWLWLHNRWRDK